jgi:hypothetical protein
MLLYNFNVHHKVKETLVNKILTADKVGLPLLKIKAIPPNELTLLTFRALQDLYHKCENNGLKIWIAGSWAVAGIHGDFIKNTNDIDISVRTLKDGERLIELLLFSGYSCTGTSSFGAISFIHPQTKVAVDIGSIQGSVTAFKNVVLHENEYGEIVGFKFRILPRTELLNVYQQYVFEKGRNAKQDLKKIKILK